ncbi:MAG: multiheme c-type cytochrome [Proteobacteria bacterium]|nr:multiheme c-type cytochrome [Pseudomonadota bacterium]
MDHLNVRTLKRGLAGVAIIAAAFFWLTASSNAQVLPQYGKDKHLGVASCAGSTCHGGVQAYKDSPVLQNEYVTWQREDRHAKAYQILLNDRSKRIAANLGLPAAHTAKICLDCHSDNVAQETRGRQFQVSDGVGCESCHGGSVRWLGTHVAGASHQENVQAGLYPTENPVKRAELCLSCHFGDGKKFVTHRIMGAGHPRMSFELDTFTAIQPAHYRLDSDYRKRKQVLNGVQTWAIGQAIHLRELLEAMIDPEMGRDGIFPELVLFDCHACHHPMSNLRWQKRDSSPLGPGIVRINDSNMIMLRIIASHVDAGLGNALKAQTTKLHSASTQGAEGTTAAAKEMLDTVNKLVGKFASHSFAKKDMEALLNGIIQEGVKGEFVDYATAEQATMAMGSIVNAMRTAKIIDEAQYKTVSDALNGAYEATAKDEAYKPTQFVDALRKIAAAAPK